MHLDPNYIAVILVDTSVSVLLNNNTLTNVLLLVFESTS